MMDCSAIFKHRGRECPLATQLQPGRKLPCLGMYCE